MNNLHNNKYIQLLFGKSYNINKYSIKLYYINIFFTIAVFLFMALDFYYMITMSGFDIINFAREVLFFIFCSFLIRKTYKMYCLRK